MKFVKKIRDNQVEVFVTDTGDSNISVEFVLPAYGSRKRGEQYLISELNQLVLQEVDQNLVPTRTEGRHKALRRETKTVRLEFNRVSRRSVKRELEDFSDHIETQITDNDSPKGSSRKKNSRSRKR